MDDKKSAAPGSQPDTTQEYVIELSESEIAAIEAEAAESHTGADNHFSETEKTVADSIAQYMQRYPFGKAHELYEAIILTMQFLNDVKAAGIAEERAWEVLTLSSVIDCHNRG